MTPRNAAVLALALAVLPLAPAAPTRADMWCAQPLHVHEWGVHVFGPDGTARAPTDLPAWLFTPATSRVGAAPTPVRNLPADTGIRRLPVVHFSGAVGPGMSIPVGLEVGFTQGKASLWYPDVDRLGAATERRQLVWDRLDLRSAPTAAPRASDLPWVAASRALDALWVDGAHDSERFVFYEADTHEPVPLRLARAPGWTRARRAYTLTNAGHHAVHDVALVHREATAAFAVYVATLAPGGATTFVLEDHATAPATLGATGRAWARAAWSELPAPTDGRGLPGPDGCVMGRNPATPFERADGHRLAPAEVELVLAVWAPTFFDGLGTRVVYREDTGYLDAVMPLSVFTDMSHVVTLRRLGLALWDAALP